MKTVLEWSDAFDTYTDLQELLFFNEFEKSIFLTLAQSLIIDELYLSFEESELIRRMLSSLIKELNITTTSNLSNNLTDKYNHIIFDLPDDCRYIVYELLLLKLNSNSCLSSKVLEVVPTTLDEYSRLIANPFKNPSLRRALRLDIGNNLVDIVTKFSKDLINSYYIKYVSNPEPIILVNLNGEGLLIEGKQNASTCKLPESIHSSILDRAVKLALLTKINNSSKQ